MNLNQMFEDDRFLDGFLRNEQMRRIQFEGPPDANFRILKELDREFKIRENGRKWDINLPCTHCDENECLAYLKELSGTMPPIKYVYDNVVSICKNPLNNNLLAMLCSWRKHVKETFVIQKDIGSEKWKKHSICTSELTFLGRKTDIGGILGTVSLTNKHICSIPSLVSLLEKEAGIHDGLKCLSAGTVMMIAMYNQWDLYTLENKTVIEKMLKKIKKHRVTGLDTFQGPWYIMFKGVLERKKIPDKLIESILSRAHLP
jgi:hypothetical protein